MTHHLLVDAHWITAKAPESLVIADCRYDLLQPEKARAAYLDGHIPHAYFLDLERDLCTAKTSHGGRHPLPTTEEFTHVLSRIGMTPNKTLLAYDLDGSGSAHLWWLCRYYGIDNVVVLQGGLRAWQESGLPLSQDLPDPQNTPAMQLKPHLELAATRQDVINRPRHQVLIDSRAYTRYTGEHEPIDPVPGRIPGAVHSDWTDVYTQPAEYCSTQTLQERFQRMVRNSILPPIVYCGSGVSACANILAMHEAGIPAILYAGSYSDWVSYPEAMVDRGDP